jgi:hypothetical protein
MASGASSISGRQVQVLEDPVEQRERALDLDLHVEQLAEWEEEPALERGEGDDVADRGGGGVALDGQPAGEPVHERRVIAEDRPDDHEEPAPDHRLAQLEPGEPRVEPAEPLRRLLLLAERLGQQHAADREGLLGDAEMSARLFWVSMLTSRRTLPTR